MRMLPVALVLSTAAGAGQTAEPAPPPAALQSDRVMVAVLRRDGVITPFALLRGRRWSTPWPTGLRARELPLNIQSVPNHWWGGRPPGTEWRAWLSGGRDQTITLETPAQYAVHCSRRMGIRTDYRSGEPLPPLRFEPFPKDGIAISDGDLSVQQVEIVPRTSDAWPSLAVSLLEDLDRAEDTAVNALGSVAGWSHPVRRADRQKFAVRLESWYRTPLSNGGTASYIEAVRSYEPRPEDEGCGLETFFSGWIFPAADGSRARSAIRAKITYCDRVGAMYMLPFGVLRAEDRVYWLYQLSGWEDEWYVVADVGDRSARIVAEYYAGGRDSCG